MDKQSQANQNLNRYFLLMVIATRLVVQMCHIV